MGKMDLKEGDTIVCHDMKDLKKTAAQLARLGYEVECKGWRRIRECKLTINKIPKAGREKHED